MSQPWDKAVLSLYLEKGGSCDLQRVPLLKEKWCLRKKKSSNLTKVEKDIGWQSPPWKVLFLKDNCFHSNTAAKDRVVLLLWTLKLIRDFQLCNWTVPSILPISLCQPAESYLSFTAWYKSYLLDTAFFPSWPTCLTFFLGISTVFLNYSIQLHS